MEGYAPASHPKRVFIDGAEYQMQYFQSDHCNEYTLRDARNVMRLYKNGVLSMTWKEEDNSRVGEFTVFDKGRVAFKQHWDNLMSNDNYVHIINHRKGELMEIIDQDSEHVIYRGEFNDHYEREGRGIEFDRSEGHLMFEGIWEGGKLKRITKMFNGDEMTEFFNNGDNIDLSNRIPVYVGGFFYDDDEFAFLRDGLGCLIDERIRVAVHEGVWKKGEEEKGIDLISGYYHTTNPLPAEVLQSPVFSPTPIPADDDAVMVQNPSSLSALDISLTNLVIASESCKSWGTVDINQFSMLQSLDIGDKCFEDVDQFSINGLKNLISLKIGANSFTKHIHQKNTNRTFHIVDCSQLKTIEIGCMSFSDYGGEFELKNVPKLESIRIGEEIQDSSNFYCASLVIQGKKVTGTIK